MMANRWRELVVAAVLAAFPGIHVSMAAGTDINGIAFEGVFPTPLLDPLAWQSRGAALMHLALKITNHTAGTLRLSAYLSALPELLTRSGAVVPFHYGANRYPPPRVSDYPLLEAGQSVMIPVDGTCSYRGGQLDWKGSGGLLGFWDVTQSEGPYRLRLKYRQSEPHMSNVEGAGTITGIWTGEATTDTAALPLSFER